MASVWWIQKQLSAGPPLSVPSPHPSILPASICGRPGRARPHGTGPVTHTSYLPGAYRSPPPPTPACWTGPGGHYLPPPCYPETLQRSQALNTLGLSRHLFTLYSCWKQPPVPLPILFPCSIPVNVGERGVGSGWRLGWLNRRVSVVVTRDIHLSVRVHYLVIIYASLTASLLLTETLQ